jgi:DNA adenine methylase
VAKNTLVVPVVKWVGGKRQIIDEIITYVPDSFSTYYEPFLGGGAVLFELQPKKAVVNDVNEELMNIYEVIKDNVDELIEGLKRHKIKNDKAYFYEIREG